MANGTCTIDGCENTPRSAKADWCPKHYHRWYRHGDPLATAYRTGPYVDLTGQRFGNLTVTGQAAPRRWDCICDCGRATTALTGDLNRGTKISCGDRATHRRHDVVGYSGAHSRVRSDLGPASAHSCIDCGDRACHWSYNHDDLDEFTDDRTGLPYSLNAEHYDARCVPCHKTYDLAHIHHAAH